MGRFELRSYVMVSVRSYLVEISARDDAPDAFGVQLGARPCSQEGSEGGLQGGCLQALHPISAVAGSAAVRGQGRAVRAAHLGDVVVAAHVDQATNARCCVRRDGGTIEP